MTIHPPRARTATGAVLLAVALASCASGTTSRAPAVTVPSAAESWTAGPGAAPVVVLDPGHNGGNASHPEQIDRLVDAVTSRKECDTVGAQTAAGYPEHVYTFTVAREVEALLVARGVKVVLTRPDDTGVGPCVDERAAIGNRAHADAAVSIHADGGPVDGTGFHVIEPVPVGPNDAAVPASVQLGTALHDAFAEATGEPDSSYLGTDGIDRRGDLGGLNGSTVPKVFIEGGNMNNPADAARLTDPAWQQKAARGIADGILTFLSRSRR